MPPRKPIAAQDAVIPASMSHESLMALLGQTGAVAAAGEDYHRMSLDAGTIVIDKGTDNEQTFFPQKNGPVLTVRIVEPPEYYFAIYLSATEKDGSVDASRIERPELNEGFARKYDDPSLQAKYMNPRNEAFEELRTVMGKLTDPRNGQPLKPAFKADLKVQIVPDDGVMTGDETIYTLTLSATSIFEWRGMSRQRDAGFVSEQNFIVKLGNLAIQQAIEAGLDEKAQERAVLDALTSLRLGGVIADLYTLKAQNTERNNSWWIVSFTPVHIEPLTEAPALGSGEPSDENLGF